MAHRWSVSRRRTRPRAVPEPPPGASGGGWDTARPGARRHAAEQVVGDQADGLLERRRLGVGAEARQDRPGRGEQLLVGRVVGGAAVARRRRQQVVEVAHDVVRAGAEVGDDRRRALVHPARGAGRAGRTTRAPREPTSASGTNVPFTWRVSSGDRSDRGIRSLIRRRSSASTRPRESLGRSASVSRPATSTPRTEAVRSHSSSRGAPGGGTTTRWARSSGRPADQSSRIAGTSW